MSLRGALPYIVLSFFLLFLMSMYLSSHISIPNEYSQQFNSIDSGAISFASTASFPHQNTAVNTKDVQKNDDGIEKYSKEDIDNPENSQNSQSHYAEHLSDDEKAGNSSIENYVVRLNKFYPPSAVLMGQEGDVVLSVNINEFGKADTVEILASSGYPALDQAAIYTTTTSMFIEGVKNMNNITMTIKYRIR